MNDNKKITNSKMSDDNLEKVSGGNLDMFVTQRDANMWSGMFQPLIGPALSGLASSRARKQKGASYDYYAKTRDFSKFAEYFNERRGLKPSNGLTPEMAELMFDNLEKDDIVDLLLLEPADAQKAIKNIFGS